MTSKVIKGHKSSFINSKKPKRPDVTKPENENTNTNTACNKAVSNFYIPF